MIMPICEDFQHSLLKGSTLIHVKLNRISLFCRSTSDLYKALDKCKVGDEIDLEVLREQGDKAKEHIFVTLESS